MFNFWKSRTEQGAPRCVLLGLDCSGKTTLLYVWHSGRPVTTIPTIGFNLETIRHAGRTLQVLDFGGCDKLAPMARHYLDSSTGILFLHALNLEPDRIEQSIELLQMHTRQLLDTNGEHIWIMLTKQDLVHADDLDSKRAQACTILRKAMLEFEGQIEWKIFDERGLSALDWVKIWPVFDDIAEKLTNQDATSEKLTTERQYDEEQLRRKIMREEIDDEPVEIFWKQFLTAELPQWNHRNHLRAGFLMLLKSASMLEDFWTAVDTFLEHIERLRSTRPDRFRNTAHRTMTTFWLYALQLAILKFRDQDVITHRLPREDQFQGVLLANPQLADPGYWEDYYSRAIMFTPEARGNWCLPDKKPLLTNFQPTAKVRSTKAPPVQHHTSVIDTKSSTIQHDENQSRLLAFALSIVQEYLRTGERRGKAIANSLARLQKSTLQLRAASPSSNIEPYSETQAYFWIQIVHATLLPFREHRFEKSNANSQNTSHSTNSISGLGSALDLSQFQHIFSISTDTWNQYYSSELWSSVNARINFVNPDLRPLPNVFKGPSPSTIAERFLEAKEAMVANRESHNASSVEKGDDLRYAGHTREEAKMRIDAIAADVETALRQMMTSNVEGRPGTDENQASNLNLSAISAHNRFLVTLFVSFQRSTDSVTGRIDTSKFISHMLSTGSTEEAAKGEDIISTTLTETGLVQKLSELKPSQQINTEPNAQGVTHLLFYAHMTLVLGRKTNSRGSDPTRMQPTKRSDQEQGKYSNDEFRKFLLARPDLLWEDLPFRFYTPETWCSFDSKQMMIAPDVRALPQ